MKRALTIVRTLYIEGRHLNSCFIDQSVRAEGWRKMQQAKRMAHRLGYKMRALV